MLHTPDYYFPSEPDYDVPWLLQETQLESPVMPARSWGSQSRKSAWLGLYHFYVDDYRFSKIIQNPVGLINTGCRYATEINPTVSLLHPRALILETIFWKRWVNRVWQQHGIKTTVDVNIPTQYESLCFLGVPREWFSFSTRGYSDRLENLHAEFAMCQRFSLASRIVFMVFGGGLGAKQLCEKFSEDGWVYIPDYMEMRRGHLDNSKILQKSNIKVGVKVSG